jgi:hypothetical protein
MDGIHGKDSFPCIPSIPWLESAPSFQRDDAQDRNPTGTRFFPPSPESCAAAESLDFDWAMLGHEVMVSLGNNETLMPFYLRSESSIERSGRK